MPCNQKISVYRWWIFFVTHGSCLRETFRFLCCWERGKETQLSLPTTRRLGVLEQQRSTYCAKTSAKILSLFCMCIHHASLLSSSTRRDFERCLFCFRCITRRVADSYFMHHSRFMRICTCWRSLSLLFMHFGSSLRNNQEGNAPKTGQRQCAPPKLDIWAVGCEFRIHDLAGVLLPNKSGQPICLTYPLKSSKAC